MTNAKPFATIRLLKDFHSGRNSGVELSELFDQLARVPDLNGVQLRPEGGSTVVATLPASNQRQKDRLQALLLKSIRGWRVIEDSSYSLPASF